jgi:hypothetical protein
MVHEKTYVPSILTEAVDVPLFKSLKLAEPGPDFVSNTRTYSITNKEVLINVQFLIRTYGFTVGFSFKLTEILLFYNKESTHLQNHWIGNLYINELA